MRALLMASVIMTPIRKLTFLLVAVLGGAFFILGFYGREVYRQAPPIPAKVITESGRTITTHEQILDGQQVWQSIGGQQVGSIWGHGAYQAPDWTADWLHREATALLDRWAGGRFDSLSPEAQDSLRRRLVREMRTNRYDEATGTVTISDDRAAAIAATADHYARLFGDDEGLAELRRSYAIQTGAIKTAERREMLTAFFFWTSWAATTQRPGAAFTYTNNWPHEPLVDNVPTSGNVMWSIISVVLLLAGIGGVVWYQAFRRHEDDAPEAPARDPLDGITLTPSMKAIAKYAAVVLLLFVLQVLLGILTAHYSVEGNAVFGLPLGEILPYSLTRTWHIQLAVFWIATAFLGAGLFLAPAVGGREPKYQRLGVNVLFGALLVVVLGSMAGQLLSIRQVLGLDVGFWFGHQGYEYVDLGRAWQVALFVGLVLWLVLMLRGLWPAVTAKSASRPVILLFAGSAVAIGLFYGAGFMFSARTHLSVMEYWRWWVVHLWVEGFFEVFATAALAFLFTRFGLIREESASRALLASTALFLVGGIPGTFHHLYFSGTPMTVMAVGASFSALEVVPLVLIGLEAKETLSMESRASWMAKYRWPIRFFVGVAFWNLVGAGLFGFLINPPIALYYMQGLNTTPVHAHTALFGVYGLLALGLTLLVVRRLWPAARWNERALSFAFWSMNVGLGLMVVLSLLPIGILQTMASMEQGLWFARSAEFMSQPVIHTLRWARIAGDVVFASGVGALVWFVVDLALGMRQPKAVSATSPASRARA